MRGKALKLFYLFEIIFLVWASFFGYYPLKFPERAYAAATVYADSSTGNDANDCSSSSPCKTFTRAYAVAVSGDMIDLTGTFDWSSVGETGDASSSGYTIAKSLTIQGQSAGETFIQADATPYTAGKRIFTVNSGIDVTIQRVTLRYGYYDSDSFGGTAVYSTGNLTILDSIITENANPARFGGPAITYGSSGRFIMRDSTMHNNGKTDGYWRGYTGAISGGSAAVGNEITNCTFYNNRAEYNGALYISSGTLTVTNSTFLNNWATVSGIDIHSWSTADIYLKNNIFADRAYGWVENLVTGAGGQFFDGGNNIIEYQDGAGFTNGVNGNLVGEQASLNVDSGLSANGSDNDTLTVALLADSVAINAGDAADAANNGVSIPANDQRGYFRSGTTDIGAYEYNGTLTINEPTTQTSSLAFSSVTYNALNLSWTSGNGNKRLIFAKAASTGTATPVDHTTYNANAAFGSGTQIDSSGWYAVYKGSGSSVSITGLTPGTDYIFQSFEFNGGSGVEDYLTDTATDNPATQATPPVVEPATQANSVGYSSVDYNQMTVSWSNGNGEARAVFIKQTSSDTATPVDGTTYTANTTFGSGTEIGSSGWYCIYNGTGTNVTVTGLANGTDYAVQVFEYNGTAGIEDYLADTASNNPKIQSSLVVSEPTQATNVTFSGVTYGQMTVSWTNGDGAKRAVFIKAADRGTASPVDNTTYTANTTLGSGAQIDSSGWYCIYNGTGTSVTVTGLTPSTDYSVQVFDYNYNNSTYNYNANSATDNPAVQATTAVTQPTTQASSITYSGVSYGQFTVNWSNGNGENRIVFVKQASSGTTAPVDGTTYTANATFESGTQVGSTGWYAVYAGTGTGVTVSGLSADTGYITQVFEYNGTAGIENYLTDTATNNPNSQATSTTPSGEDFELGTFDNYPWTFGGNQAWTITSADKNGGTYSARAGAITHSQTSYMQVSVTTIEDGNVTYYRKVSSEGCCDYFKFYIDGVLKENIAGSYAWGQKSFAVTAGTHTYKWYYGKDGSVNTGSDTAWVDDIVFPTSTYSLHYSAGAGGSISGSATQSVSPSSDGTAVTAIPDTGYSFVDWSDASTDNPRTDTNIGANINVTANFSLNSYSLNYNAPSLGVSVTGGTLSGTTSQTVDHGSDGTAVTAVPSTGYRFTRWSDDSTNNPRTDTTVTGSLSIYPVFSIQTFTLTYSAGTGGSLSGTTPQTVNYDSDGTAVTAVPSEGYSFVKWSDNSTNNPRTETSVNANVSVSPVFSILSYALTYSAGTGGSISGTTPQTVNYGSAGSAVTATAASGYAFSRWSDGSTANPRTDTNITANVSVTASFTAVASSATTTTSSEVSTETSSDSSAAITSPQAVTESIAHGDLTPKAATPLVFKGKSSLLPIKPLSSFVLAPLPPAIQNLAQKFTMVDLKLKDLGVSNLPDVSKLANQTLSLPSLSAAVNLPTTTPIDQMTAEVRAQLPSETVFIASNDQKIEYNTKVTFKDPESPEQVVSTIAGTQLSLSTKPDGNVNGVTGRLIYQSGSPAVSENLPSNLSCYLKKHAEAADSKLITATFDYTDTDHDGIYTANVTAPVASGQYQILTSYDYVDPDKGTRDVSLIAVVDPKGYIYEKINGREARVSDAKVTLLWKNPDSNSYEKWPADKYSQQNPQTTDKTGEYSFLVPDGKYKVKVETNGYRTVESKIVEIVQNRGVSLNIEVVSKNPLKRMSTLSWSLSFLVVIIAINFVWMNKNKKKRRRR